MHHSIRKRGCSSGHRQLECGKAGPRLVQIIILAILSSCAGLDKRPSASVQDIFSAICFTGEGKGRLVHSTGRHLFDYESLLNKEEKEWVLGVEVPLRGEEVMRLDYGEALQDNVKISGSFTRAVIRQAQEKKNGKNNLKAFKYLMARFGAMISFYEELSKRGHHENCEIDGSKGVCRYLAGKRELNWNWDEDKLVMTSPLFSQSMVTATFSQKNKFYEKMNFEVTDSKRVGPRNKIIELTLFQSSCDASM